MKQKHEEKQYAYWLMAMPGMGSKRIAGLLELCGDAKAAYGASESLWRQVVTEKHYALIQEAKAQWDVIGNYEKMLRSQIGFVIQEEPDYPKRLREIPDPPYGLFYKGELPREDRISVAVIGARACSEYGRYVATELGQELGRAGIQVISGMARGIDGISQQGAVEVGGRSFGILGSGVDVCYPEENRSIYNRLLQQGGILSEYVPGTGARSQNFPPRNRIVSGLSDAIVVVEAREKSGTLITVDMALEQGREVFVVPGRITDRLSDGCNKLLRQGAGILLSPRELIQELEKLPVAGGAVSRAGLLEGEKGQAVISQGEALKGRCKLPPHLNPALAPVFARLDHTPKALEELRIGLPEGYTSTRTHMLLMELCLEKLARQVSPGYFCLFS